MRSGLVHLRRKGATVVPIRSSRRVMPAIQTPEPQIKTKPEPRTALNENMWSVVSSERVEAGGMTYDQARQLIEALADSNMPGLCIVTDAAATRR